MVLKCDPHLDRDLNLGDLGVLDLGDLDLGDLDHDLDLDLDLLITGFFSLFSSSWANSSMGSNFLIIKKKS